MTDQNMKLRLLIEAKNNADAELKNFQQQVGDASDETHGLGKAGTSSGNLLSSGFSKAAGGIGILVAGLSAAAAGVSALVVTSANEVKELENLARLAKMTSQEFAAAAYATNKYGISAEQLADISKDVQDKLGDFVATGGGEFADFFENVAPKVGLTAEQLQKLSGPDVLVAVKKAMDDANVSAAEQVFYLEAIGNDASKLIPLLANNGEELRKNAERAKELGVALSEVESQKLLDAKVATDEMTTSFNALKNKVAAEFAPVYTDIMTQAVTYTIGLKSEVLALSRSVVAFIDDIIGSKTDAEAQLHDYQNRIGELLNKRDRLGGSLSETEQKTLDVYRAQVVQLKSLIAMQARRNAAPAPTTTPVVVAPTSGTGTGKTKAEIDGYNKGREALQKYIETQQEHIKKECETVVAYATTGAERSKALARYNEQMAALSSSSAKQVAAANKVKYAISDLIEWQAKGAMVGKDMWLKQAEGAKEAMKITAVDTALEDFFGELDEMGGKTFGNLEGAVTGWASSFSGTLTDMITGADVSFSSILHSFSNMIIQMMIQKSLIEPLMSGLGSGSGILGSIGGFLGFAQGGVPGGAGLSAYRNQIVSQPTFFAFASGGVPSLGVAGEVPGKKEGILPLATTSTGNLGVEAIFSGGGGSDSETKGLLRELIGAVKSQGNVRVINAIDSSSIVNAMSGAEGERMILNTITKNPSVIRRTASGG